MSGIAGIARARAHEISVDALLRMAASLRHRGPDGYGIFADEHVGLAHVRLSTIDPKGGAQPLEDQNGHFVIVHDGAIQNHPELRAELEALGHRFRTRSDAEVLVHGYEQWGEAMLHRLDGHFGFAVYDRLRGSVFLARDRFGVRPLFYSCTEENLVFGSEAKSLFASGHVRAAPDVFGLDEAFTLTGARAPRTPFAGVSQLEPGSYAIWRGGRRPLRVTRYFEPRFTETEFEPTGAVMTLGALLEESVTRSLRADTHAGVLANGGIEARITCAVAERQSTELSTFSVSMEAATGGAARSTSAGTDAGGRGSNHHVVEIAAADLTRAFERTVWHAEAPLLRTQPAVEYLLASCAREQGTNVVLAGDGAEEAFLGYDLFKETAVRLFCLRHPESRARPLLFDRIYPDLRASGRAGEYSRRALVAACQPSEPLFSHMPRFLLAARIKDFYSGATRIALAGADPLAELRQRLPAAFPSWNPLNRAAYIETVTFLPSYLLSQQGDRVAFANGVEVRYPFLDHRLFEFATTLPTGSRLRGLHEREILGRWAATACPAAVQDTQKRIFRADVAPFFAADRPDYVRELLSPQAIARIGLFDVGAVAGLVRRCEAGRASGLGERQALLAILSTQLWHQEFVASTYRPEPLPLRGAEVVLTQRSATLAGGATWCVGNDSIGGSDTRSAIHLPEFSLYTP